MTHEEIQADLSLFVLGTLDAEERAPIERHLSAGCVACERELAQWREVVTSLPLADDASPARDLKAALLGRVRNQGKKSKVVWLRPAWIAVPLAAAASLLLVLSERHNADLRQEMKKQSDTLSRLIDDVRQKSEALDSARASLETKDGEVARLRAALAAADETVAILRSRGLQLARLSQTPEARPAEGHVLISLQDRRAIFYAFDLSPVPADKTYELWWITEQSGPVRAGLFNVDPSGVGKLEVRLPSDAGAIRAAAVTIEPAGGTAKPTGPMVLLGNLA